MHYIDTIKTSAFVTRAARSVAVLAALVPAMTVAAPLTKYPWNIPDNVRIVQKAPVDDARTFATIQGAINSITGASATNRFVVQVMPGTYTESITAKDFVDIEGIGEGTILQDDGTNPAINGTAAVAGFSVRNLTIQQRANHGIRLGTYSGVVALRKVVLQMPSTSGSGIIQFGDGLVEIEDSKLVSSGMDIAFNSNGKLLMSRSVIEISGAVNAEAILASNPTIRDSVISVNVAGSGYGVMVEGGSALIVNSEITVHSTESVDNGNFGVLTYWNTSATIRGSRVEVTIAAPPVDAAALTGSHYTVDGSVLIGPAYGLITRDHNSSQGGSGPYAINNSSISGGILAITKVENGTDDRVFVGNSRLAGGHSLIPGTDKVVGCYDESYNPILNQ